MGAQFIESGAHQKVLVIGAEVMSSILDFQDRTTCVLFGDGAGAVLLEPSEDDSGLLAFTNEVDGSGGAFCKMPAGGSLHPASHETIDKRMHYVKQEGQAVFKYAVRKMAEASVMAVEKAGLRNEDIDLFIPHQANIRIIEAAQARLGLPDSKVVKNIATYGNTTAATIPLGDLHRPRGEAPQEGRQPPDDLGGRRVHRGLGRPALVDAGALGAQGSWASWPSSFGRSSSSSSSVWSRSSCAPSWAASSRARSRRPPKPGTVPQAAVPARNRADRWRNW